MLCGIRSTQYPQLGLHCPPRSCTPTRSDVVGRRCNTWYYKENKKEHDRYTKSSVFAVAIHTPLERACTSFNATRMLLDCYNKTAQDNSKQTNTQTQGNSSRHFFPPSSPESPSSSSDMRSSPPPRPPLPRPPSSSLLSSSSLPPPEHGRITGIGEDTCTHNRACHYCCNNR